MARAAWHPLFPRVFTLGNRLITSLNYTCDKDLDYTLCWFPFWGHPPLNWLVSCANAGVYLSYQVKTEVFTPLYGVLFFWKCSMFRGNHLFSGLCGFLVKNEGGRGSKLGYYAYRRHTRVACRQHWLLHNSVAYSATGTLNNLIPGAHLLIMSVWAQEKIVFIVKYSCTRGVFLPCSNGVRLTWYSIFHLQISC